MNFIIEDQITPKNNRESHKKSRIRFNLASIMIWIMCILSCIFLNLQIPDDKIFIGIRIILCIIFFTFTIVFTTFLNEILKDIIN